MQNPRKRIKSLQLSCQAANSSWETTFSAPFAPRGRITAAGLAQSVARLTAEREVAGSIPAAGPILRVLKITEK